MLPAHFKQLSIILLKIYCEISPLGIGNFSNQLHFIYISISSCHQKRGPIIFGGHGHHLGGSIQLGSIHQLWPETRRLSARSRWLFATDSDSVTGSVTLLGPCPGPHLFAAATVRHSESLRLSGLSYGNYYMISVNDGHR